MPHTLFTVHTKAYIEDVLNINLDEATTYDESYQNGTVSKEKPDVDEKKTGILKMNHKSQSVNDIPLHEVGKEWLALILAMLAKHTET